MYKRQGALFTTNFHPVATLDTVVNTGLISAIADNAGIFLFLVLLGIIVALVNKAGGSAAFGRWAKTHIKTRVGAQFATFFLGVLIFICLLYTSSEIKPSSRILFKIQLHA